MALSLSLEEILVKAPTEAAAFAAGLAIHPVLAPVLQDVSNFAWREHPDKRLDLVLAAEVAAEDVDTYGDMEREASFSGFDANRFKWAYGVTLNAPGSGELLAMLRRQTIKPADFTHGLRKAKLEPRWDEALAELEHVRLTPQQLALGIVRSTVTDPGLLAVTLDTSGGVVPAYPVWDGNVLAEARAGGIDAGRLRVMVGEIGLPMSAQQAASAYFRDIIRQGDFNRAILEGDTRPEWAPFILEQARQIPTAHDGIEWRLRGWTDDAGMYAQTRRHGMSKADTDLLFQVLGRPLSFHQVFIGERRGGVYDGPTDAIDPAFLKALRESNIRPEWYNLAWAQRYSYPSPFVLRSLAQAGDLGGQAAVETILLEIGWPPKMAADVSRAWVGGGGGADTHVGKAQTQLWNRIHTSYLSAEIDEAEATATLPAAGVDAAAIPAVLQAWDAERDLIRKQLTPTQLRKALGQGVANPVTGQPYTFDEVRDLLVARGYTVNDATVFLQS